MKQTLVLAAALGLALGGCKDKDQSDKPAADPKAATRDAAPVTKEDGTLRVHPSTPEIGMTIARTDDSHMTMKIGPDAIEETEKQSSHAKVLAVLPPAIAKIEVHYETHDITRRAGSQQEAAPSPLAGKTFHVWAEGEEIKATTADGKAVSDEELELLAIDHVELGKVPQIEQLIRARDWKLGEKIDLTGDELTSLAKARGGGDESIQTKSGSLTWVSRDGDLATFEGDMTVVKDDERARIESVVKTTVRIEVDTGRVAAMVTSGTMKGEVKGKEPAPIEGTLESRISATYGK